MPQDESLRTEATAIAQVRQGGSGDQQGLVACLLSVKRRILLFRFNRCVSFAQHAS